MNEQMINPTDGKNGYKEQKFVSQNLSSAETALTDPRLLRQHRETREQQTQVEMPAAAVARLPPTSIAEACVAQQRQQKKQSRTCIRSTYDGCHGFAVDWMAGEEKACYQCGSSLVVEHLSSKSSEDGTRDCVQDHVRQMIAHRLQLMQVVVESEGEDSDWSVGLV